MLTEWHYLSIAAPLVLLVFAHNRKTVYALVIAIVLAASAAMIDLRIRSIRMSSPVPISSLSREDPIRRRFGALHGISSILLLAEVLAAGFAVAANLDATSRVEAT